LPAQPISDPDKLSIVFDPLIWSPTSGKNTQFIDHGSTTDFGAVGHSLLCFTGDMVIYWTAIPV
jgi:hypothetical protein